LGIVRIAREELRDALLPLVCAETGATEEVECRKVVLSRRSGWLICTTAGLFALEEALRLLPRSPALTLTIALLGLIAWDDWLPSAKLRLPFSNAGWRRFRTRQWIARGFFLATLVPFIVLYPWKFGTVIGGLAGGLILWARERWLDRAPIRLRRVDKQTLELKLNDELSGALAARAGVLRSLADRSTSGLEGSQR
jgi:hypothetical protein